MVNLTFEENEDNELKQRIAEAANYLLRKNKNFVFLDEEAILFDKKEKKYYDIKTGEIINNDK